MMQSAKRARACRELAHKNNKQRRSSASMRFWAKQKKVHTRSVSTTIAWGNLSDMRAIYCFESAIDDTPLYTFIILYSWRFSDSVRVCNAPPHSCLHLTYMVIATNWYKYILYTRNPNWFYVLNAGNSAIVRTLLTRCSRITAIDYYERL